MSEGFPPLEAPTPTDVRDRLYAGTYDCVARFGLSKTTIDDVAARLGPLAGDDLSNLSRRA